MDELVLVDVVTVATSGAVSQALQPNTFYKFTGSLTSLTLTLTAGNGLAVYAGKFTAGADDMTITLPSTVKLPIDTVAIKSNNVYEFNIADNICLLKDVTVE